MQGGNDFRALSDGGGDTFDRAGSRVADREHTLTVRLQR
jgi:hypothetical protein